MLQNQSIPKKGDIIINPNTQRPIKVGSRTWLGLVKKGIISGHYRDPRELEVLPEEDDNEQVEQRIQTINKTLPRGKQAVRGRGKYKGKIVSRNRRADPADVSRYTAQIASRAVSNNIDALVESDDIEGMLEQMILQEMMATRPASAPPVVSKKVGRPKKKQAEEEQRYELQEPDEYDDETEEEEVDEPNEERNDLDEDDEYYENYEF